MKEVSYKRNEVYGKGKNRSHSFTHTNSIVLHSYYAKSFISLVKLMCKLILEREKASIQALNQQMNSLQDINY